MSDDKSGKKLCVPSGSNSEPGIAASPPRFVSLEELMSAAKGMTQMTLAHEITLNHDFKLEMKEPPANSLESIVKETVHKAFWDVLALELNETPPRYTQALVLLEEVKSSMLGLLLPQHSRLRQKIDEVLDMELMRQQAEKGTLHEQYMEYAQFVIGIMGKLCAPVRDDRIAELTMTRDVVPLFRGILDTLSIMKVDMANFTIDLMRPNIVANSVAYEKQKFADFLKVNPEGLDRTREWLRKHLNVAGDETVDLSKRIDAVIHHAYLDLVQWDPNELLPETLTMDEARIKSSTQELLRLTRAGTVLLIVFSHAGPNLASIASWKQTVKNNALTLITADKTPDMAAVAVKMAVDITDAAAKYNVSGHSVVGLEEALKSAIEPNHKVFDLLNARIREFLLSAITSRTADRLRVPPGLSILQDELTQLAGSFLRMVSHSRDVFGQHYISLLSDLLTDNSEQSSSTTQPN